MKRRNSITYMRKIYSAIIVWMAVAFVGMAQTAPKREFRGAWIQCVNGQFQGMSTEKMQQTLTSQLDKLREAGINAIIFQVRPEADALYKSQYEPWSRFLTGVQGQQPSPDWDPLRFMIEQCHRRGMELHAWINPYRAKTKGTQVLAPHHPARLYPDRCISYDGQLYFDPGLPENRRYICKIVTDIVKNYDVDALHMDDYFYPYPVKGEEFGDDASFAQYGRGFTDKSDWRRNNVNLLIQEVMHTVRGIKPWVKFGVSPFGIWRNRQSDGAMGSDTRGLQNYDDLYADVLTWVNNGWVDYNIPQVYWEIGHPAADYEVLVKWWAEKAGNRPLFIGQDVMRTVKHADPENPSVHQLPAKMEMQRAEPAVSGSCQWPASAVVENVANYHTLLAGNYHRYPALQPEFPFMDNRAPGKVKRLKEVWTEDGLMLFWTAPKAGNVMDEACQYVVYRFAKGEKVNIEDPSKIVAITQRTYYKLPYQDGKKKYRYVVTALDRLQNESKGVKTTVKL